MNKFLVNFALIIATLSFVSCATPVEDCNNGIPLPAQTQVNDCEEMPCELAQGSTAVLNVTFVAPDYIEGLSPEVIAYALGLEVNYPLNEQDGCNSLLSGRCPIDAGEAVLYKLEMPILSLYPTISLQMKFTIYDQNSNGLVCFLIDAQVVSGSLKYA